MDKVKSVSIDNGKEYTRDELMEIEKSIHEISAEVRKKMSELSIKDNHENLLGTIVYLPESGYMLVQKVSFDKACLMWELTGMCVFVDDNPDYGMDFSFKENERWYFSQEDFEKELIPTDSERIKGIFKNGISYIINMFLDHVNAGDQSVTKSDIEDLSNEL